MCAMREDWIDRWKGFLIYLVVLGHAVGVASHFSKDSVHDVYEGVFKVIYCFHMPAFFCLAGYVWKVRNEDFCFFIKRKFERLVVPYLVFAVISGAIYYCMAGAIGGSIGNAIDDFYNRKNVVPNVASLLLSIVHAGGVPQNGVFAGNSVLWFLPTMFTSCVAYWVLNRYLGCAWGQSIFGVVSLVASHFIPRNLPWGVTLVPYYLFFIIAGRWGLPRLWALCEKRWGVILPLGFAAYLFLCLDAPNRWYAGQSLRWRLLFAGLALLGTFVSALLVKKVNLPRWMADVGLASLGIMLLHKYVILALGMKLHVVRNLYGSGIIPSVLTVSIVTFVALFASYFGAMLIKRFCPGMLGERKNIFPCLHKEKLKAQGKIHYF